MKVRRNTEKWKYEKNIKSNMTSIFDIWFWFFFNKTEVLKQIGLTLFFNLITVIASLHVPIFVYRFNSHLWQYRIAILSITNPSTKRHPNQSNKTSAVDSQCRRGATAALCGGDQLCRTPGWSLNWLHSESFTLPPHFHHSLRNVSHT